MQLHKLDDIVMVHCETWSRFLFTLWLKYFCSIHLKCMQVTPGFMLPGPGDWRVSWSDDSADIYTFVHLLLRDLDMKPTHRFNCILPLWVHVWISLDTCGWTHVHLHRWYQACTFCSSGNLVIYLKNMYSMMHLKCMKNPNRGCIHPHECVQTHAA